MLLHELIEQFLVGYNHLLNIENRGKDTTFFSILQTNLQKSKLTPKKVRTRLSSLQAKSNVVKVASSVLTRDLCEGLPGDSIEGRMRICNSIKKMIEKWVEMP